MTEPEGTRIAEDETPRAGGASMDSSTGSGPMNHNKNLPKTGSSACNSDDNGGGIKSRLISTVVRTSGTGGIVRRKPKQLSTDVRVTDDSVGQSLQT